MSLFREFASHFTEEEISQALYRTAASNTGHVYAPYTRIARINPKNSLVVRTESVDWTQIEPPRTPEERLMRSMFPIPKPFVERRYYSLFPDERPLFLEAESLTLRGDTQSGYRPTGFRFLGERTPLTPLEDTDALTIEYTPREQVACLIDYQNVGGKCRLVLNYNQDGNLLFYYVNTTSHDYEGSGYTIADEDSRDPDELSWLRTPQAWEDISEEDGVHYHFRSTREEFITTAKTPEGRTRTVAVPIRFDVASFMMRYIGPRLLADPINAEASLDNSWRQITFLADMGVKWEMQR